MARIRTNKNICLYCFGNLDHGRVCETCHKKADDTPSPPHHLPQRTVLAEKYLISKALGEGGFGITYLAWDLSQGIKVAVKEYFPSGYVNRVPRSNQVIINSKQNQAASNRGLKRFIDEAKTLAKVKNLPGIVSVRDFFSANGTAYIVMEYLDGLSLKKYLQRKGGKIPCDEILTILRPIMESLVEVHRLGLIHRDISPDNIIITKSNEVKLIDFGAAKQSNLDGKSLSIVLKQGFAPEEQYRTHGEQGPWTDIYALGVTIYFAITGMLPPESIQRMYKDTIVRPSEKGATVSPTQESALMKSLAVYSEHRYRDVSQMMKGLYGSTRRNARKTQDGEEPSAASPAPSPRSTRLSAPKKTTPPESSTATKATARATATDTKSKSPEKQTKASASSVEQEAAEKLAALKAEKAKREALARTQAERAKVAKEGKAAAKKQTSTDAQKMRSVTRERKPTLMEKLFGTRGKK
ncbi:MAG: serine/threonine protein kinase [Clostridiales bacterium]|nr:serine/threonine protein kinase [Clostridiales bacterium]